MNQKTITILQLYPREMNIYGDWGNTLVLKKRLERRGFLVKLLEHHPGAEFPQHIDLITGGGGQDSGQDKIQADLLHISPDLHKHADDGTPMLVICGLYQLFGNFFKTKDGHVIKGAGIFNAETHGGPTRLIGNIVTKNPEFGEIIGYENHSGLTYLHKDQQPLGHTIKGVGNNDKDSSEGAIYNNVLGSYLHGSLLPKNPTIADFLIQKAIERKYGEKTIQKIDDSLANKARLTARDLQR